MAAFTADKANIARQKAYNAVYGTGVTASGKSSVSPYHFYAVKSFFLHLAANLGNKDVAFLAYSAEDATTNLGTDLAQAAGTLYMWYAKGRRTTGTTAAFEALHQAADNSATTTTVSTHRLNIVGNQFIEVWPNGFIFITGLTVSSATAVGGATESAAADSSDGFVIVS